MVTEIVQEAVLLAFKVGGPIMLVALVVGLIVALFQALTQIQEMTLTFVPKIIAIFIVLAVTMPFMIKQLVGFTQLLADRMISLP